MAKAPKANLSSLRILMPYLAAYRSHLALTLVAIIFTSFSVLGLGHALKFLVDNGIGKGDTELLNRAYWLLAGVIGLLSAASYARYYLVWWVGECVIADMRNAIFTHLLRMDVAYFETNRTGDILSRLTTDSTLLQTVLTGALPTAIRHALLLTGGMVMLLLTSTALTEYLLLMLPMVVAPILLLGRRVRWMSREAQARVGDMNAQGEEAIGHIRLVQGMTMEQAIRSQFARSVQASLHASLSRVRFRAVLNSLVIALVFGAVVTVMWVGGREVIAGNLTSGALSAFVFYAVVVAGAVGALSEVMADLQRAAGAAERMAELLVVTPVVSAPVEPVALPASRAASVSFENVVFRYPSRPERPALEQVSFRIEPGETVAVVGPSGAGKTTIFQLLLRFYDPESGHVTFNGVDVRKADPAQLRSAIGFVPQEPMIFSGNAWMNIRAGRPEASDDEILEAAEAAHALEFLEKLPEGLNTHLGQKGVQLSGGQKQRLAIARAIIRKPSLLLLDEATSALDAESEHLVREALKQLMKDRTTLVIAHRFSTLQHASRVLLMNKGKLEMTGTHAELVQKSTLYARLAMLQGMEGS